jgi:DNA modification methylase
VGCGGRDLVEPACLLGFRVAVGVGAGASPGQAVYEPFSGSGTTIIAAQMTGRVCHAIEIAPAYVDVAVKRWQELRREGEIHRELLFL